MLAASLSSTLRLSDVSSLTRAFKLEATLGPFTPWRLSGLLSGYLPTDTRPQARAKLGNSANRVFESASQHFFSADGKFLRRALAALLSKLTQRVEREQLLSFFNEALASDEKRRAALSLSRPTRAA